MKDIKMFEEDEEELEEQEDLAKLSEQMARERKRYEIDSSNNYSHRKNQHKLSATIAR